MIETLSPRSSSLGVLQRINANRGPREYLKALEEISREVSQLCDLSRAHMRAMASTVIDLGGDAPIDRVKNSPVVPTGKKSTVKKSADMRKLEQHYLVTVALNQKRKALDMIEADMEMNFGVGDTTGLGAEPAWKKAQAYLQQIRQQIANALKESYQFMTDMAQGKVPASFIKLANTLANIVSKTVSYEENNVRSYLYVNPDKDGRMVFTQYLSIVNMEDDEGQLYPRYFVVLTGILDELGALTHYLTTLREFDPPGLFPMGKDVTDAKTLRQQLAFLFHLDGVSNNLARVPLAQLLSPNVTKDNFTVGDMVSKLIVEDDEMQFRFKRGLSKNEIQDAAQQIYVDLTGLMRRTQSKVSMKISKDERGFYASYVVVRKSEIPVAFVDLEFLKGRFDVDDRTIEKLVDTINRA